MAQAEKKKVFSIQGFDANHYKQTEGYVQAIDALYNSAVNEFAQIGSGVTINPDKPFSFSDYPQTKNKAQQIINDLAAKMQVVIKKGSREQWLYACKKNDQFLASILNTSKIPKKTLAKYQDQNLEALKTFQGRKVNGLDLSQRIWNYAGQMKTQMELGIDIAVGEGKSAQGLSKDLRQYLVDPDKLFHRVRNKHGQLVLSKNAKAFHPGQGKYRSSYKNAMRLTRSEINMAYRESDQNRWSKLDFIVGYEVKLSNNHTLNGKPFKDICDELEGKYPKSFIFKGWHPQCRCHVVPVMQDRAEFNTDELSELKAALNGTEYKKFESKNTVNDVPQAFKDWIATNAERAQGWKSQPYFIKDNYEGGNIAGGLKIQPAAPQAPKKPIKTPEQKAAIQSKWDQRVQQNEMALTKGKTIFEQAKEFPEIDTTAIQEQIAIKNVKKLQSETQLLEEKVKAVKAEETQLSTLLDNVKDLKAQHGPEATKELFKAVEAKLAQWEDLPIDQQKKKLLYEIQWVEENKKYSTWKGSQDAYKKKLSKVEYLVEKQAVQDSITSALSYASSTKSPKVKQMADEVQSMLDYDAPISKIKAKATELNDKVNKLVADNAAKRSKKKAIKYDGADAETYSQARKDAALWAKAAREADKKIRDVCSDAWKASNEAERLAAYRYTAGSSYINEPLRNLHYSGQYAGKYDGKADAKYLSNIIEKSSYDFDMWVQRGVGTEGVRGVFNFDIAYKSIDEVRSSLMGKIGTEPAFSSCGVSKGAGFADRPVVYNIYCPRGTKMLYSEPFSAFGHGVKSHTWDGIQKQSDFGYEAEMVIQRGTQFRVTKVEKTGSRWFIDVEVVAQ